MWIFFLLVFWLINFIPLHVLFFYYVLCASVSAGSGSPHSMYRFRFRSEDNSAEVVLSFHMQRGSRNRIQVGRFDSKLLIY